MSKHRVSPTRVRMVLAAASIVIAVLGSSAVAGATTITEFSAGIPPLSGVNGIAAGPDGNLWFAEGVGNQIGVVFIVLARRTHIKLLQGPAVSLLTTTLDRAVRVGIIVQRIVGTQQIRIGRVAFGFHRKGRPQIRWDLRVNGRKLPAGRYLVTLRAVDGHHRVIARALPLRILIR